MVIPAFGEEATLENAGSAVSAVLEGFAPGAWEIVLVDDGSRDATPQIAARLAQDHRYRLVRHDRNRGKGAAVRSGVLLTTGQAVAVVDADLAVSPELLAPFVAELFRGADLVTGDRHDAASHILRPQSRLRRILGRGYVMLARWVTGMSLCDFNCGFKVFRGDVARTLLAECRSDRWAWDVEVIAVAVRRGWVVRTLPVTWRHGDRSSVRPFRAALGSLRELASIRARLGAAGSR